LWRITVHEARVPAARYWPTWTYTPGGDADPPASVRAATPNARRLLVYRWCPRDEAIRRLSGRGTTDLTERLEAWDHTEAVPNADLTINTGWTLPSDAADAIDHAVYEPT
jgi:guanylate kinase